MTCSIESSQLSIPSRSFGNEPLETSSFMVSHIGRALPYLFSETREKTAFVALKILSGILSAFFSYHLACSILHICRGYSIYASFSLFLLSASVVSVVGSRVITFYKYLSESIEKESSFQRKRIEELQKFFQQEPKCFSEDEINELFKKYKKEDACELFRALTPEDVAKPIVLGVIHKKKDIPFFTLYLRNKNNEEAQLWIYYLNPNDNQWSIIKKNSNNALITQFTAQGDQYFNREESKKLQEILNGTNRANALKFSL